MQADLVRADARRLAARVGVLLTALTALAATVAWLVRGPSGAASAAIGVAFVGLLFGVSALGLAWVVGRSPGRALAVLGGGSLVRLVVYAAALSGLAQVTWVDRPSLALATGAAVAVTLAVELPDLARSPRLFWIDADAAPASGVPHATRSGS